MPNPGHNKILMTRKMEALGQKMDPDPKMEVPKMTNPTEALEPLLLVEEEEIQSQMEEQKNTY